VFFSIIHVFIKAINLLLIMGDYENDKNFIDKNWAKTYNVVSCLTKGGKI